MADTVSPAPSRWTLHLVSTPAGVRAELEAQAPDVTVFEVIVGIHGTLREMLPRASDRVPTSAEIAASRRRAELERDKPATCLVRLPGGALLRLCTASVDELARELAGAEVIRDVPAPHGVCDYAIDPERVRQIIGASRAS